LRVFEVILVYGGFRAVELADRKEKQDYDNFLKGSELKKLKEFNVKSTLFLKKLGLRKLWMPDKYRISRKVKIAESFNELVAP
jgi:hypothetical protein